MYEWINCILVLLYGCIWMYVNVYLNLCIWRCVCICNHTIIQCISSSFVRGLLIVITFPSLRYSPRWTIERSTSLRDANPSFHCCCCWNCGYVERIVIILTAVFLAIVCRSIERVAWPTMELSHPSLLPFLPPYHAPHPRPSEHFTWQMGYK